MLPDLITKRKDEQDIHDKSPRTFTLNGKKHTSHALSNFQYKILLVSIINLLSKYDQEEIKEYTDNKSLLFNDLNINSDNESNELNLDLIICSCCDPETNSLLLKLIENQNKLRTINSYITIPRTKVKGLINLAIYTWNYVDLKKTEYKTKKIYIALNKRIYELTKNCSHFELNIAFNYIIEQNNIIDSALSLIKKNKKHIE